MWKPALLSAMLASVIMPTGTAIPPDNTQKQLLSGLDGQEDAVDHVFSIQLDYRFDRDGFFDDPLIRANLEEAVNIWSSYLSDDFPTVRAGTPLLVMNPYTLQEEKVILDYDIDDLVLFVAGNPKLDDTMAKAGPISRWYTQLDTEYPVNAKSRVRDDNFEPWAGFLAVNPKPKIPFRIDSSPESSDDIPRNSFKGYDLLTLLMHEMGHVLGIGTSKAFTSRSGMLPSDGMRTKTSSDGRILFLYNAYSVFYGRTARRVNNGNLVMLSEDRGHTRTQFLDHGQQDLMDQDLNVRRQYPTIQDLAILTDIGYETIDADLLTP